MTTRLVHRPTRVTVPLHRPAPEELAAPPASSDGAVGGMPLQTLLPVVGALTSVTMIVVLRRSNPLFLVVGAVVLVVALVVGVGFAISQRGNTIRQRRTERELYLDYLERLRATMRARAREVRLQARDLDPDPGALAELVRDPARLWERRRSHPDFLSVRLGVGDEEWFGLGVPPAANPVTPYDPIMLAEAEAVARHYSAVLGKPVRVDLDRAGQVAVVGPREDVLAVARALVLQLAALHAPDDVQLAAAFPAEAADDWAGFDRLPHVTDPGLYDAGVPVRRVASSAAELQRLLGAELTDRAQAAATARRTVGRSGPASLPRLVVLCDDHGRVASGLASPDADLSLADLGVTMVHLLADRLDEPSDVTVRVTVTPEHAVVTDARPVDEDSDEPAPVRTCVPDRPSPALVAAVARSLAPLRLSAVQGEVGDAGDGVDVTELLGIADVEQVSPALWRPRSPRDFLRVPIGTDDFGARLLLDLKESAELGMGPHGICIGATGSGKSEMLRTLVLALALSHPPEDLAMILVDYKGGAAFAAFEPLPHVAGIIDNLADDPQLTERARASINGEVVRRQEVLRDAGSSSISHYRELRATRPDLAPMPHLFVVIDEFGELLTAEPEFVELLISIGRIGRSIGVHLLLSSQRIEAGRLRGLDTYLSYRIGLRTFSAAESAVVLDTPDAFHLPAIPGYGYLKVDTSVYRRFRSGYVSGPASAAEAPRRESDGSAEAAEARRAPRLLPVYNTLGQDGSTDEEAELSAPYVARPLVAEAVDRLQAGSSDRTVPPVWLPTLPDRLALARVLPDQPADGLQVIVGLLDDPARQRQGPWTLDLGRSGGHVAVIGAPGTGRTGFLRTVATSLALSRTPREVSVYGMDLTGGGLRRIEGFPHVGGVATRANRDQLVRLLEELRVMLAQREAVFREHGIESAAMLRAEHAAGRLPELGSAEIVLLVDGVHQLRSDFEELEEPIVELLQRGGSFGIHLVLALTRWNDLRMAHQALVGTRLELRLNDPADSTIARKLNAALKPDQPGRVLTEDHRFAQVALPVLDDVGDEEVGAELERLAAESAERWTGPAAAPIRLLPTDLDLAALPDAFDEPDAVPFGLRQDTMAPALLELGLADQHLLVFGDTRAGKTTALRTVVHGLLERYTSDEVVLAVMDLRGDVAAEVPDDYLGGHASTTAQASALATAIAAELEKRLEGDGAEQTGARRASTIDPDRSRIVVVVDDYDILASGRSDPLRPLLPFLASARDLKLHVLLTRPVAGSGRAMFDVTLQTLRDTGGTLLLMSGERGEGQIVPGVYAEQMVPGRGRLVRRGEASRIVQVARPRASGPAAEGGRTDAA